MRKLNPKFGVVAEETQGHRLLSNDELAQLHKASRLDRGNAKAAKAFLMAQVLLEYQDSEDTLKNIASRHGISIATITVWAKKNGITLRGRGLNTQKEPSPENRAILALLQGHSYREAGLKFGVSKSRIATIVKRWRNWARENHIHLPRPRKLESMPIEMPVRREPKTVFLTFRLTVSQASKLRSSVPEGIIPHEKYSLNTIARFLLLGALESSST